MVYFSNGSQTEILQSQCNRCRLGEKPCPIAIVQDVHNHDQADNPDLEAAMNLLVNEQGICQMMPLIQDRPNKLELTRYIKSA